MIKRFTSKKLHGVLNVDLSFFDDINVLTGINGSGKTTVLKVMWLIISGNIDRVINQFQFEELFIETDKYFIKLNKNEKSFIIESDLMKEDMFRMFSGDLIPFRKSGEIEIFSAQVAKAIDSSVFFPTFRRIEGGFAAPQIPREVFTSRGERIIRRRNGENEELDNALNEYSNSLSNYGHRFICSLSTNDIKEMLGLRFSEVSAQINEDYRIFSKKIMQRIGNYKQEEIRINEAAISLIEEIKNEASKVTQKQDLALKPFNILSELIDRIFNKKGIRITEYLSLGHQVENIIDSSLLSSGEKQMLSFLCYNIFLQNSPFFIDEPELSLHVDWQRRIFSILLAQKQNNQFFIATHSPMIYSKYSDNEIAME